MPKDDDQPSYYINYPDFLRDGTPPCAETDPEAFFPQEHVYNGEPTGGSAYYNEKGAKAICNSCPYKKECLEYALTFMPIGIWGGTTDRERIVIQRANKMTKNSKAN